jgi:hypothetical protein
VIPGSKECQEAHTLLVYLSNQKSELVTFFRGYWEDNFSVIQVPPVAVYSSNESIVRVNRMKCIQFLKDRYNFYNKEELREALEKIAEDIQTEQE